MATNDDGKNLSPLLSERMAAQPLPLCAVRLSKRVGQGAVPEFRCEEWRRFPR